MFQRLGGWRRSGWVPRMSSSMVLLPRVFGRIAPAPQMLPTQSGEKRERGTIFGRCQRFGTHGDRSCSSTFFIASSEKNIDFCATMLFKNEFEFWSQNSFVLKLRHWTKIGILARKSKLDIFYRDLLRNRGLTSDSLLGRLCLLVPFLAAWRRCCRLNKCWELMLRLDSVLSTLLWMSLSAEKVRFSRFSRFGKLFSNNVLGM